MLVTGSNPTGPARLKCARRIATAGVLCGVLLISGYTSAYRFYSDGRTEGLIAGAEHAPRWDPEVWGPGETLYFEVAPDPDFAVLFDSPEGVLPYVERALAAWSEIPSADISLGVSGIAEEDIDDDLLEERAHAHDGRNTIFIKNADEGCGGRAYSRGEVDSSGEWMIRQCDPTLCDSYAAIPEEVEPEDIPAYRERRRERAVNVLVHEIGHCLGLAHSGALSITSRSVRDAPPFGIVHPRDPAMSYGIDQEAPEGLTVDDVVAASLLRPAPGWQRRTGSLSGLLTVEAAPAPYAQVWALPVGGDPLRDRIGVFSNGNGEFLIEGLESGFYVLWGQPLYRLGAHPRVLPGDPALGFDDVVRGSLIRVRTGRTTGDLEITMREGRSTRPPPEALLAAQEPGPPTPITRTWGSPCAGVRSRAERPYPANGPLWFTGRWRTLRGDRWFGTRLEVEWSPDAENVVSDWAGSYRAWWWDTDEERAKTYEEVYEGLGARVANLDVSISAYRIERVGSAVRHIIELAWPESTMASLRFRSEDDACDGEPMVVCDLSGCEIRS